jgi:iron complex outermembrane receptor protein
VLWGMAPVTSLAQRAAPVPPPTPEEENQQEVVKLDTVTVAGSYIKRTDVEKVLPVTVVNMKEMEVRGATQTSDLLTMLPEIGNLPHNEADSDARSARGAFAAISLRGLPAQNTVILLNGRRVAPHPISSREPGSPSLHTNVNILPFRGLERIEVLRDGASSLYGSDAVAGVVNFVTRKDLRGTELSLRFSETEYRDGAEVGATLMHGLEFSRQRGRAVLIADFYNRQALYLRDRPFSAEADHSQQAPPPWNLPTNTTFNLRSATSEYGNYSLGTITGTDAYGAVTFAAARPTGIPATLAATSGQFFLQPGANSSVVFATATPSRAGVTHDYYWNNNAFRVIQPQSTRLNLQANLEYDLNDRMTAFADLSHYQARSRTYREPDAYQRSVDGYLAVPTTNP